MVATAATRAAGQAQRRVQRQSQQVELLRKRDAQRATLDRRDIYRSTEALMAPYLLPKRPGRSTPWSWSEPLRADRRWRTVILVNWLVDSEAEVLFKNGSFDCGHSQVSLPGGLAQTGAANTALMQEIEAERDISEYN